MKDVYMQMKNKLFILSIGLMTALLVGQNSVFAREIVVKDNATEPVPVDFPGRVSLSEEKEAPLPSLSESIIKEPTPMERVVSKKEAPSEQLLGRITPEVFHEMADLERGNVFLELQTQREELKNKVEDLKSKYREARLAEIEKRENVIRSRVKWQQEQEKIRQEILKEQLEREMLEKQLEESEVAKEDLLPMTENKPAEETGDNAQENNEQKEPSEEKEQEVENEPDPYRIQKIIDIKGMKGNLTARVVDSNGKNLTLKVGSTLSSGQVVKDISKTEITLVKDDVVEILDINDLSLDTDDSDEFFDDEE